ncbi:hypothetical protein GOV06_05190 [Candidatus Woesearchaeota archaeon]|nr:hypothetical protein [Candidatus Woesearchaeota archaeon]
MDKNKLAEFIGWHIGDGCLSISKKRYQYFLTGDIVEEYSFYKNIIVPTFNDLFGAFFDKKIKLRKYKSNNVCGIYIGNKNFVKVLNENIGIKSGKKINITIPEIIKSKNQKIAFLRGLFDTDGSIYYCKSNFKTKKRSLFTIFHYKPKIKLATISKELIEQVYDLLIGLGFSPMIRKPAKQKKNENIMYGVELYRIADTKKWINEIGFKNSKHLTKVLLHKKFGFCPPYSKIKQRKDMLDGKLNPLTFYPSNPHLSLNYIKKNLSN